MAKLSQFVLLVVLAFSLTPSIATAAAPPPRPPGDPWWFLPPFLRPSPPRAQPPPPAQGPWWWLPPFLRPSVAPPAKGHTPPSTPPKTPSRRSPGFGGHGAPPINIPWASKQCRRTISSVENCVSAIINSFWSGRIGIGPACCRAIHEVSDECFDKMIYNFNNPFFGSLIKEYCARPGRRAEIKN